MDGPAEFWGEVEMWLVGFRIKRLLAPKELADSYLDSKKPSQPLKVRLLAVWRLSKRIVKNAVYRYAYTYRCIIAPSLKIKNERFAKVRQHGLSPWLFMGLNYTLFSGLFSIARPYSIRSIDFSNGAVADLLETSIGPIDLRYALLDLLVIGIVAILFAGLNYIVNKNSKKSVAFFVFSGMYAFGAIFPFLIAMWLYYEWQGLSSGESFILPHQFISTSNRFISSPLVVQFNYRLITVHLIGEVFSVWVDYRVLLFGWVAFVPEKMSLAVISVLASVVTANEASLAAYSGRVKEYATHSNYMEPTIKRGTMFRLNENYFKKHFLRTREEDGKRRPDPSILVVGIDECTNSERTYLFTEKRKGRLLTFDGVTRPSAPIVVAECPMRQGLSAVAYGKFKTLARIVAASGQEVEAFDNGRILVSGNDYAEKIEVRTGMVATDGSPFPDPSKIFVWRPIATGDSLESVSDNRYYWDCAGCTETSLFRLQVPQDKILFMFDSMEAIPRFFIVDKTRTDALPFFKVERGPLWQGYVSAVDWGKSVFSRSK